MNRNLNNDIVISCPIKNDNEYLLEFVEHYLNLGFDKIYFYDNNDEENIRPETLLSKYIADQKVVIIDYRNMLFIDKHLRRHFFINYSFDWVLFVDSDEFLELRKHDDIRSFLVSFDSHVVKIAINNLHYGDNDVCYYEKGKVQDRFKLPLPLDLGTKEYLFNSSIKSFLKKTSLEVVRYLNPHSLLDYNPYYNSDNKKVELESYWRFKETDITYETAYIKHYCTKSLEEFVKCKVKRATKNNKQHLNRFGLDSYYFMYNERTKEKEELVKVFVEKYLKN